MYTKDNKYLAKEPRYTAAGPPEFDINERPHIRSVIAQSDMIAASDVVAVLAMAGRREPPRICGTSRDDGSWTSPVAAVGGNSRTDQILRNAIPRLVRYRDNAFEALTGATGLFVYRAEVDCALVYKGEYGSSRTTCLALMGLGTVGIEAAGYFLRSQVHLLGCLFGARGFAVILDAPTAGGPESAKVVWYEPHTSWWKWVVHPRASFRWRTLTRGTKSRQRDDDPPSASLPVAGMAPIAGASPLPSPGASGTLPPARADHRASMTAGGSIPLV
jgi:hypothetical protein